MLTDPLIATVHPAAACRAHREDSELDTVKTALGKTGLPWRLACFAALVCILCTLAAVHAAQPRAPSADAARGPMAADRLGAERAAEPEVPAKVYRYARRLVQRYDRNRDGKLQPDEWRQMPGHPEQADANGDQVITVEELAQWIAAYGAARRIRLTWPVTGAAEKGPPDQDADKEAAGPAPSQEAESPGEPVAERASDAASKRDTKFRVSAKRIPAGLPDWFLRRDLDGDGQLTLSEFAPKATGADRKEFNRYDLNGDGVITPQEYLKATKAAKKTR